MRLSEKWLAAFNGKYVENAAGCMLWTGRKAGMGYGYMCVASKSVRAHRYSYQLAKGDIPAGMFVCHRCDVRTCINPDHLFLGTPLDNARDMTAKGRGRDGARNGRAKLTIDQVREIRRMAAARVASHENIGRTFGVSQTQISEIVKGVSWRDA